MTVRLFRASSLLMAFSIPLLLFPSAVFGAVSFPSNPKTMAECEGPAAEMRAMEEREQALASQGIKERKALPYSIECARDERCREAYYDQAKQLHQVIAAHHKERDRIHDELRELEKTCRAAVQANKQETATLLIELSNAYDKAKSAYEQAKALYNGRIPNSTAGVYAKRNDANSDALESAMNNARRYILDLVPKSEIIRAIQNESFSRLKSQIQQLNGDMAALESAIQSVRAEAPPAAEDAATVVVTRRGGNSGSAMFQNAINQAEQEEKDRKAREKSQAIAAITANAPASANARTAAGAPASGTSTGASARPSTTHAVGAAVQQADTGFPADGLTGKECLSERELLVNGQWPGSGEGSAKQAFEYYRSMHEAPNIFPKGVTFPRKSCNIIPGTKNSWRHPDGRTMHVANCYQDNYWMCLKEARYTQLQKEKTSPRAAPTTSACFAEVARIDRRVNELQPTIKSGDSLSQFQLIITATDRIVQVLEKCDRDPVARQKRIEYRNINRSTNSTCQKTMSNPLMCGLRFEAVLD